MKFLLIWKIGQDHFLKRHITVEAKNFLKNYRSHFLWIRYLSTRDDFALNDYTARDPAKAACFCPCLADLQGTQRARLLMQTEATGAWKSIWHLYWKAEHSRKSARGDRLLSTCLPCPTSSSQTLLTCELSNLLWEGALCWVLVLGWRAGQMALKLLLLLENAKINRKQDPHKTKTKRSEKSKLSKFVTQRDSCGDNVQNLIWGILNKQYDTE